MLEAKRISKSYHGTSVLSEVSFCLPAGQCLGITGSNGAGKSTLLRIAAQILRPDSGDILFDGKSILGDWVFMRSRVGYVPQDNELAPDLTVAQQLKLWQSACGIRGAIPGEIIELLGLEELMRKRTQDLSGGMQRRVSIAMGLLNSPEILIMDEATTGLDRAYCPQLLDWLEGYMRRGGRMLWCSHQSEELRRLCGTCLHLDD